MIRDLKEQAEKAVNEVNFKYSKGMKFFLEDLMAVQVCLNENNFLSFKGYLSNKLQNDRIAVPTWINGKKGFMKK
ncbi:hypothetical protein OCK72_11150 [Fusobacterium simiae]|uniref:Uncharacterized protein n=1 Tax=Fusobacterium simiae TaxID=855 RepID=A0ABT4DKN5_FUSSI|nr:hypothetical protein [Fusobacterium simiae]MCY7009178.1 hypothetical protein [Fusobacterium simiae]